MRTAFPQQQELPYRPSVLRLYVPHIACVCDLHYIFVVLDRLQEEQTSKLCKCVILGFVVPCIFNPYPANVESRVSS
jgi:hypothetical protein